MTAASDGHPFGYTADLIRPELAGLAKPVEMPGALSFTDLFPAMLNKSKSWPVDPSRTDSMRIGNMLSLRHRTRPYAFGRVTISDAVLETVQRCMLNVENDRTHFEAIDHGNGFALIVISYGSILGSRWLAYVKTDTVPWGES